MYATIHSFHQHPDAGGLAPEGALGSIVLAHVDDEDGTAVAFWPDRVADGRLYRVDVMHGRASGRRPLFAQVTWMNGDGAPERADAAERGGRDRIWPAVREFEGIVDVFALRSEDHRVVVVALTTDTETHDRIHEAIVATELLPGEDPALLPGPDRITVARVLRADLPTAVRS
jgi:hypothetical protein